MDERAPKIEPKPKMVTCPSCKGSGTMSAGHCILDFYGPGPYTVTCSTCKGMRKVEEEPEPNISTVDPTPEEEKAARDAVTEVGAHRMGVAVRRHLEIVFAQALAKRRALAAYVVAKEVEEVRKTERKMERNSRVKGAIVASAMLARERMTLQKVLGQIERGEHG